MDQRNDERGYEAAFPVALNGLNDAKFPVGFRSLSERKTFETAEMRSSRVWSGRVVWVREATFVPRSAMTKVFQVPLRAFGEVRP